MSLDLASLGIQHYSSFVVAVIGFLLVPGPGNLTLISATGRGGPLGGLAATVGVIIGDQMLLWAAVAGVAGILLTHPTAFTAVRWCGAAYLVWVGAQLMLSKPAETPVQDLRPQRFVRQAIAITLTNPKAIVFYLAFLPQFIEPTQIRGLGAYVFLAVTLAVLTLLYGIVMVTLTHKLADNFRAHPGAGNVLKKGMGAFLILIGLRFATNS